MEAEKLNRIHELETKKIELENQIEECDNEIKTIKENCDHKYPNGKSSIEPNIAVFPGGKCHVYCNICGGYIYKSWQE